MTRPALKQLAAGIASTCLAAILVACSSTAASNNAISANSLAAGSGGDRGPSRQILYSVNSTAKGTDVTAFRVNSDGSLTLLGTALETSNFTVLVASSGRHAFAKATAGPLPPCPLACQIAFNTLITFSAQPNGRLRESFSTPLPSGALAGGTVLNPAGTFLFVVLTIPGQSNATIATFAVRPSGKLVLVHSGSGLSIPGDVLSLAVNPAGTFLYAATLPPGSEFATILQFAIGPTGALTQVGSFSTSVPGGTNITITPNGKTLYFGVFSEPQVTRFSLNSATGALTEQNTVLCTCFPTSDNGRAILVSPQGTVLLQLVSGEVSTSGGVAFYSIDPNTEALTPLSSFAALGSPGVFSSFALDSSGTFLYATDQGLGILGFSISASGAVTPVPGSPFPEGGGASLFLVNLRTGDRREVPSL